MNHRFNSAHPFRGACAAVLILVFALLSSAPVRASELPAPGPLEAAEATALLKRGDPDILIVDVRRPDEHAAGHFAGSINIPVEELDRRVEELPRDKKLLLHCRTGKRAGRAWTIVRAHRPEQTAWYIFARPVFSGPEPVIEDNPAGWWDDRPR